jgi:hypothetical protein
MGCVILITGQPKRRIVVQYFKRIRVRGEWGALRAAKLHGNGH